MSPFSRPSFDSPYHASLPDAQHGHIQEGKEPGNDNVYNKQATEDQIDSVAIARLTGTYGRCCQAHLDCVPYRDHENGSETHPEGEN